MTSVLGKLRVAKKYLLLKPATGPVRQTDFYAHTRDFDVKDYGTRLSTFGFDNRVVHSIPYKNDTFPISQIDICGTRPEKRLLIFAGVHGNEFTGLLAIEDVLGQLKTSPELYDAWSIRILAPINPVGTQYMSRYDQDGFDINRDFKDFLTLGARLQRDVIDEFKPDIIVTLHESIEKHYFMFSEGKLPTGLADAITSRLTTQGVKLAPKSYLGIKTRSGIWEKPSIAYSLQKLARMHTLGSYVYRRKIPTLTTESDWSEKDLNIRKLPHTETIIAILTRPDLLA